MNAVRERAIIMGAESVRAILDGRKTQTRRVVKPQPYASLDHGERGPITFFNPVGVHTKTQRAGFEANDARGPVNAFRDGAYSIKADIDCPYGAIGGWLWVRETWGDVTADHPLCVDGRKPTQGDKLVYAANDADAWQWRGGPGCGSFVWRSPIFMPRWASRITLELTDVRVERVRAITEEDACDEGCYPIASFAALWDSLNAKRGYSWDSNPFCWKLTFALAASPERKGEPNG